MALQLFYFLLITITTTMTNFAGGELFLQMPLTINPVVQEVITTRGEIIRDISVMDPEFYSKLTPVDMVITLGWSLSHVMRKTISGAVVGGAAAKADGLATEKLVYNPKNKWTVNISLTHVRNILTRDELHLYPFSDNITLSKLQKIGLRVLQARYNVSLYHKAEPLRSSSAKTYQGIERDWIKVVRFITTTNIKRLAVKHEINEETLAQALNMTSNELHNITLNELDAILLKEINLANDMTTAETTTKRSRTVTPVVPNKSPTHPEEKTSTAIEKKKPSQNLDSSLSGKPTEGKSEGTSTIKLALFVGVAVGLLLLLVGSSSVWCFRRKREHLMLRIEKKEDNNTIILNNV